MRTRARGEDGVGCFIVFVVVVIGLIWIGCASNTPENRAIQAREEHARCQPRFVTSNGGVTVWKLAERCNGNDVDLFFSTKSVDWTEHRPCGIHCGYRKIPHSVQSPP